MGDLTLAIVGCGGMGRRHVHGLAELRDALSRQGEQSPLRLTVVIDSDPDRASALADEAEMLLGERPVIRHELEQVATEALAVAADICTGTDSHHQLGLAALACGLHVFVEKPLAATIRGAKAMIAAARDSQLTLGVAENVRREPVHRLARALISAGVIGDIRFVLDASFSGADAILLTPWRHRRLTGGVLLDIAVHSGDVIEYLAGPVETVSGMIRLDEPVRYRREQIPVASAAFYSAWIDELPETYAADAEDVAVSLLSFASGAAGQWTIHRAAHGQPQSLRTIYGSSGSLTLPPERSGGDALLVTSEGEQIAGEKLLSLLPNYELSPVEAAVWGGRRLAAYDGDFQAIDRRLVAVELHDFARAVATNSAPEVDGAGGLRNMALAYAIAESAVAGHPVAVESIVSGTHHAYQDHLDIQLGLLPGPVP